MTLREQLEAGLSHQQAGRLAEAEKIYQQVLAQHPEHMDALHLLGILAMQTGRSDKAVELIRRAIRVKPDFADLHTNLGIALVNLNQIEGAIAEFREAVRLKPTVAQMHLNLANALKMNIRLDEAIAHYRETVRLEPDDAVAHANLGGVLNRVGRLDEAIASLRQAVRLKPDLAKAHNNLGSTLRDTGQLDEAIASYREAIRLKPDYAAAHSNLIFALHFHPGFDVGMIDKEIESWNQQHAVPLGKFIKPHANNRDPERRLRIGYVSSDFYDHPIPLFLLPLFRHHNREQFELFCYADLAQSDDVTRQLREQVQHWRITENLTDAAIADMVRGDQIDILVDLKLHTSGNRLLVFAQKPAPVQVTWLGYPGTTGLKTIDYRLTDPYLDPPVFEYGERPIRLPDTFWCYDPLTNEHEVNAPPCVENGFITFGCLNSFCKINPGVLRLLARVLKQVDRSRIVILCPEGSPRRLVLDQLQSSGIDPNRVELISRCPRSPYLGLYHRIDVGLDTFPYNGHTTSLDSLWMGVPVITLMGKTAVGRAGVSQLTNLGLTDLIAQTPEQFVEIASALANDLPRLSELRRILRARMEKSPLMDAPRFTRNIEAAYRQMWRDWCAR